VSIDTPRGGEEQLEEKSQVRKNYNERDRLEHYPPRERQSNLPGGDPNKAKIQTRADRRWATIVWERFGCKKFQDDTFPRKKEGEGRKAVRIPKKKDEATPNLLQAKKEKPMAGEKEGNSWES